MTSKPGEKRVERVAADANVILSAIVGKDALRVFTRSELKIVSTAATLGEVREYLPSMAETYEISPEILEGQFRLLAITECGVQQYKRFLPEAAGSSGNATRMMWNFSSFWRLPLESPSGATTGTLRWRASSATRRPDF